MHSRLFTYITLIVATTSVPITISNIIPRRDTTGTILDAHDSKLNFDPSTNLYYWHAASYGDCEEPSGPNGCADASPGNCGFQMDHNVTLYTSPDLVTWTNAGHVFSATGNLPPQSVLFAPKTLYNARTKTWVLWFNYIVRSFSNSYYGVATSSSPAGPFVLVNPNVALQFTDNGDEGLFLDDDGTAYVIYTTLSHGHAMSIERLSENFTTSLGAAASSGLFGDTFVEAPALFKRGSIYYATFGHCCCYCGSGSPVTVYTATSPLGPYTKQNVLGALLPPTPRDALSLAATPNGTITAIVEAVYAANCKNATDLRAQASTVCVGGSNCTWFVCVENQPSCPAGSPDAIPDPAYGCEKDLSVAWTCSGDPAGAPPRSAYIPSPAEGEWAQISCYPPVPTPPRPFGSQQTDIFWYLDSTGTKQYICACSSLSPTCTRVLFCNLTPSLPSDVGDHWQSAPDGLKSHDFTVWAPLLFDALGNVSSPGFVDNFTVDVAN